MIELVVAHRTEFTSAEATEIKGLLREARRADRSRQKTLRGRLRSIGFYISDFTSQQDGFTDADFADCVARGQITITGARSPSQRSRPRPSQSLPSATATTRPKQRRPDTNWHEELREQYRPADLRVLLIAESPPDPGGGDQRFFYSPVLASADNLYRGVAEAVYGAEPGFSVADKPAVLERLRADGFWLIDAADFPVNKLGNAERKAVLRAAVPALIEQCRQLAPTNGVIVCHGGVYRLIADPLRAGGVNLLHNQALKFPMTYYRAEFVAGFRAALARTPPRT